ncbi:MAG: redox-sensing transcriptional repressor Rex, partial [Eubacterium sp.]|nr:redox-sensing transcriptional repressor Rex [Eubacterium sp.]
PVAAILCIPTSDAEQMTERLIKCGIKAFWNFTHYDLRAFHKEAAVENVHLGDSLTTLSYRLNSMNVDY